MVALDDPTIRKKFLEHFTTNDEGLSSIIENITH